MGTRTKIVTAALSIALFALLSLSSPEVLYAQRRGGTRTNPAPWTGGSWPQERSAPLVFDNKPFDVALEKLPPFYAGYEPGLLYGKITSKDQDSGNPSYAVRFTPLERFYDAGSQILNVYCRLSGVLANGKEDGTLRGFAVKYQPLMDNTYIGTNASGEKVEIEEIKFREYVVAFPNFMEFPVEKPVPPNTKRAVEKEGRKDSAADSRDEGPPRDAIAGNIHLTPAEANQVGDKIQALLVFSPAPPYVTNDSVEERSTAGRLRDRFAQYYYIHALLREVWFYDFETGRVLTKLRPRKAVRPPVAPFK